jgi:hypothetical protein
LTVTASLKVTVKVTDLPASRSPLAGLAATDRTVGAVVSIFGPFVNAVAPERSAVSAGSPES